MCLDCTRNWKPVLTLKKLVTEVIELLANPNADHAVTVEIGAAFADQARKRTAQYAH